MDTGTSLYLLDDLAGTECKEVVYLRLRYMFLSTLIIWYKDCHNTSTFIFLNFLIEIHSGL